MPDRDDIKMGPIPGAPADSLMGLGGQDGFVGQCERELCFSTPPPPPLPEPKEAVTRSYPPIPIPSLPSLPEMPLRARMLRPWMGVAASAVLIALVGLASGGDDEATQPSAALSASESDATENDTPTTQSFGAELSKVATAALDAGKAAAERRAAEEAKQADTKDGDDEARDEATAASSASSKSPKKNGGSKGSFNRDAASSAIFSAASRASGCRTQNGPKGRGRATVTIGPAGNVISINVSPPFAGTKSGHCIASVFRSVRIPAFSGSAVSLGKSFTVR